MVDDYKGEYSYEKETISNWDSNAIGVYYLWNSGTILYVGSGTGEGGIKGRLLQHLNDGDTSYATNFGYKTISNVDEALNYEKSEIQRLNPRHNKQYNL